MIAMARQRLGAKDKQFLIVQHDLSVVEDLQLPNREYQIAFSVQTIHNLTPVSERKVISWVRNVLSEPGFFSCYRSFWDKQEKTYSATIDEGESLQEHQRRLEEQGDSPLTLEEHPRI